MFSIAPRELGCTLTFTTSLLALSASLLQLPVPLGEYLRLAAVQLVARRDVTQCVVLDCSAQPKLNVLLTQNTTGMIPLFLVPYAIFFHASSALNYTRHQRAVAGERRLSQVIDVAS